MRSTYQTTSTGRILVELLTDLALFGCLTAFGSGFVPAHLSSFAAGALVANLRISEPRTWARLGAVLLLTGVLRGMLLVVLTAPMGIPGIVAVAPAAIVSAVLMSAGTGRVLPRVLPSGADDEAGWRRVAIAVVGYALLLRLTIVAGMDLLPQETYYWNYGEHLSFGYLDHPPMVGLWIRLFTDILGRNEIGVRAPAFLLWLVAAWFLFRLTANLMDRASAYRSLVLFAALPIYFSVGVLMTPDAPLFACWAGALYFFERVLLAERRTAWLGVSVCLGLGMLSKYTIALLGPAALLFLLLDRRSRKWFARPEPYLAALLAAALFLPVIVWNARNDWASFAFQGTRGWSADHRFSLHILILRVLVLLTPIGLFAAVVALSTASESFRKEDEDQTAARRKRRFTLLFTLVPLSVFAIVALQQRVRLNWAGPLWIAVLPLMARQMGGAGGVTRVVRGLRAVWPPTVAVILILMGAGVYYIALGMPGSAPLPKMSVPVAWQELGRTVDEIARQIAEEEGEEPIRAGVDHYHLSSATSFYTERIAGGTTSGRHLVGEGSLMWRFWSPAGQAVGKNVLLLGVDRRSLDKRRYRKYFERLSEISELPVRKNGRIVTRLFWRVGYRYRSIRTSPASTR